MLMVILKVFCGGGVEILLLENELVAVTYYVSIPELYATPVPVGFISKDKKTITRISAELNQYLAERVDDNTNKNLGPISKLSVARR